MEIRLSDNLTVKILLNVLLLILYLAIVFKNNCIVFLLFLRSLYFISFEASNDVVVWYEFHEFDSVVGCTPFLCKYWELSAAVGRPYNEPCPTFKKHLTLWLSTNCYHRCCIGHLLDFDFFVCNLVMFSIEIEDFGILTDMLLFGPVEAHLTFIRHLVRTVSRV